MCYFETPSCEYQYLWELSSLCAALLIRTHPIGSRTEPLTCIIDAMGICLSKQKLMYKVLAPSIITPIFLMEALGTLCVRGWLSVKDVLHINTRPIFPTTYV